MLEGADVVVDVSNSPSFEDAAVLEFFTTATGNLLAAEKAAGVGHHVALSVVGTERMADKGYFKAKSVQEQLIADSGIPYSIVHATQFFEFIKSIAALATDGDTVRLPPVLFQPMASEDVAKAVGRTAVGAPVNGIVEAAGPEQFRMDELVRQALQARNDPRTVITDPDALYFGDYDGRRQHARPGRRRDPRRGPLPGLARRASSRRPDVMLAVHVIVASPEEARGRQRRVLVGRELLAMTVFHEGRLHLRIDPAATASPG